MGSVGDNDNDCNDYENDTRARSNNSNEMHADKMARQDAVINSDLLATGIHDNSSEVEKSEPVEVQQQADKECSNCSGSHLNSEVESQINSCASTSNTTPIIDSTTNSNILLSTAANSAKSSVSNISHVSGASDSSSSSASSSAAEGVNANTATTIGENAAAGKEISVNANEIQEPIAINNSDRVLTEHSIKEEKMYKLNIESPLRAKRSRDRVDYSKFFKEQLVLSAPPLPAPVPKKPSTSQKKKKSKPAGVLDKWTKYQHDVFRLIRSLEREQHAYNVVTTERTTAHAGIGAASREVLESAMAVSCREKIKKLKGQIKSILLRVQSENKLDKQWPELDPDNVERSGRTEDEDAMVELEDITCSVCALGDQDGNDILLCDRKGCYRAYHQRCLEPVVTKIDLKDDWFCHTCQTLDNCLDYLESCCGVFALDPTELFPEIEHELNAQSKSDSALAMDIELYSSEEDEDYFPLSQNKKLKKTDLSAIDSAHNISDTKINESQELPSNSSSRIVTTTPAKYGKGEEEMQDKGNGTPEDISLMSTSKVSSESDGSSSDSDCDSIDLSIDSDSDSEIDSDELQGLLCEAFEDNDVRNMNSRVADRIVEETGEPDAIPILSRTRTLRSHRRQSTQHIQQKVSEVIANLSQVGKAILMKQMTSSTASDFASNKSEALVVGYMPQPNSVLYHSCNDSLLQSSIEFRSVEPSSESVSISCYQLLEYRCWDFRYCSSNTFASLASHSSHSDIGSSSSSSRGWNSTLRLTQGVSSSSKTASQGHLYLPLDAADKWRPLWLAQRVDDEERNYWALDAEMLRGASQAWQAMEAKQNETAFDATTTEKPKRVRKELDYKALNDEMAKILGESSESSDEDYVEEAASVSSDDFSMLSDEL